MLFEKSTHSIYLFSEINPEAAKYTVQEINKANLDDKIDKILITLSSGGGFLNSAFAICEYIRLSKKPVYCLATSFCGSASIAILQCGVERIATEQTRFMVHSSHHKMDRVSWEESLEIQTQSKFLHDKFIKMTTERAGLSIKEFEKNYLPIKYLTIEEAKQFGKNGLIDKVI